MRKYLFWLLILLSALLVFLVVRTLGVRSKQPGMDKSSVASDGNLPGAVDRLARSITFPTVSYDDTTRIDYGQFTAFQVFLRGSFPLVFERLESELVGGYTLVLHWKGNDPKEAPAIFMAHQDVVPVDDDTKGLWSVPPFEGVIRDGILYGRGVIDDKINLMGQLEAVNQLLQQGFTPKRSIYFVFGHDEEIGGNAGAAKVAGLFEERGIRAAFVFDEGGVVTYDKVPGMDKPVALVGTSEKGGVTLELTVQIPGGHSSFPARETSLDVLAQALVHLRSKPFPASIAPSVEDFIEYIGPEMPFGQRLVMTNLWLFKPLLYRVYSASPTGDAMIRTTMVPTIAQAGDKVNVIPTIAKAKVNYRILPGNTTEDVVAHTRKAIGDERVHIAVLPPPREASPYSSPDSAGFRSLMQPIKHHFEDAVVAPFLMIGGTDSRHFYGVSPNIYKFSPMVDPIGFHGVDEQLRVSEYPKAIGFYLDWIKKL